MIINYWVPNDLLSPLLRCFHKNQDIFFIFDFLQWKMTIWSHFFLWNILLKHWMKPWKNLGMKAIDTSPNFSAALKLLLFLKKKKKIYFLWMHGDWPIKRQWGLRSWLDSPVEHFVTLWNDPMWRFIILITINIYIKREITFICGYYREELIWLIKSLVMFAHISF